MLGLYFAYWFIINSSVSLRIPVIIFQCLYVLSFSNQTSHNMFESWLGLHQWSGVCLSDKIFYLLMFPCFTNRSYPHILKSLGSFPPFYVTEFDPMTGKSLQEVESSLYLCVLGGFLMHEGVQTLLSCDIMYGIKNWTSVPKIAHLCSLCIEEWSKQILFGGGLVYLSFLLNLTTLNSNR